MITQRVNILQKGFGHMSKEQLPNEEESKKIPKEERKIKEMMDEGGPLPDPEKPDLAHPEDLENINPKNKN